MTFSFYIALNLVLYFDYTAALSTCRLVLLVMLFLERPAMPAYLSYYYLDIQYNSRYPPGDSPPDPDESA